MKKTFFLGTLLTLFVLFGSAAFPSEKITDAPKENTVFSLMSEDVEYIVKDGASDYKVVYSSDGYSGDQVAATELTRRINEYLGIFMRAYPDSVLSEGEHEILIGNTNRALSAELGEYLRAATVGDELIWGYAFKDGRLAFVGNCDEAVTYGRADFLTLVGETDFSVASDLWETRTATRAEYEAWVEEQERLQRLNDIEELKNKIASFDDSLFGERTPMPSGLYSKPETYPPEDQHPRLMLTAAMLPDIQALLDDPEYSALADNFWYYANMKTDGALKSINTISKTYNFDEDVLMAIEAKALAYLLTGDEMYGYEAIYAAKNFMLTLVLSHEIATDIYRTYGLSMMVTGEVYDWCYDLMTETDKSQFVRGVQKYYCEDCPCGKTDKMEIGFPPTGLYATQGHGTSTGILRDYLSFSIAIFDEYPDWWELVAGRFYQEYVPAANVFLAVGANTQGMNGYGPNKVVSQLYAAWMIKVLTGEVPYVEGLADVGKYYMYMRLPSGRTFQSGDGVNTEDGAVERVNSFIFILSALYPSEMNQVNFKVLLDNYTKYTYFNGTSSISPVTTLIYRSTGLDYEPEGTDINEGLELAYYVDDPMGEMFARNSWNTDAAAVFMRVRGLSGGNHDHDDAGTFQIYYKGCLTSESGQYGTGAGYGTSHNLYWHHATISHNGLLVYNPALSDTSNGWYSGGQKRFVGVETLDELLYSSKMRMATVTGHDYRYAPATGALEYAYLAGNISASYNSATVDTIERRMLTLYTENEEFPMFFVVYDYMKSTDASFKKSFLMHTCTEPMIDGNTATYVQNDGKMVLTTLTEGAVMTKIGGTGKTYWINDTVGNLNIAEAGGGTAADKGDSDYISDGKLWGRVQIDNVGKLEDHLLNVIYVTDATNENTLTPTRIETDTAIGLMIDDVIVMYVKTEQKNRLFLDFETEGRGLYKYFFSGLSAGSWSVKVDGVTVAHAYTTDESGLISFVAPAGTVTLEPGADVRPENSDDIIYNTGGIPMPDGAKYFYEHDVEYVLPELASSDDKVFAGWYESELSTDRIEKIEVGTRGTVELYAKFYTIITEDYEKTAFLINEATKTFNGIAYGAKNKTGTSFSTVKDESTNNVYLLWQAGASDPQISLNTITPNDILVDRTVLTYKIDLALNGDDTPMTTFFRLKGENNSHNAAVFCTTGEGKVLLGNNEANVVTTLTEELQTIWVSVDFANSIIYAFDSDGYVITSCKLKLSSADAHLTGIEYMQSCRCLFNWYSYGNASLRIDNIRISGGFAEGSNVSDPSLPNAIIYNGLVGAVLPKDASYAYSYGEPTPLPTELTVPEGMIFDGWFTDEAYTEKVTEVPEGYKGQFIVYAKFRHYVTENYEDVVIDHSNPDGASDSKLYNKTIGGISYNSNQKPGAGYKTVKEGNGNTYLLWTSGIGDPQMSRSGSLKDLLLGETAVTYSFLIASDGESAVPKTAFRIRESGSSQFAVFMTDTDGAIYLNANTGLKVGNITQEFLNVIITVDFAAGTITAYNPDGSVATDPDSGVPLVTSFAKPSKSAAADLVDFINYTTGHFYWYTFGDDTFDSRALRIDDLTVTSGRYAGYGSSDEPNIIIYEGLGDATLPVDAPYSYDPDTKTILPEVIDVPSGMVFAGWYKDADYTVKITELPVGTVGTVKVYAKILGTIMEDFEATVLDHSNPDGASDSALYNKTVNGFSYSSNQKPGAGYRTVTDTSGNTYLVWTSGIGDPIITKSGSLKDTLLGETSVTYSLKIAKDGDSDVPKTVFRARESSSSQIAVFLTDADGGIYLCADKGLKIGDLSDDFLHVIITLDFKEGTATAYNPDGSIATNPDTGAELVSKIAKPSASQATDLADFINYTNVHFYWYTFGDDTFESRALRIDDISITPGAYEGQ